MENRDKDDYFEKKLKSDYFESLVCNVIKKNQKMFFNNQIKYSLTVKDIISMGKYENDESSNIIIENYDNLELKKNITKNDYYDNNINLLDRELKELKFPDGEIKTDSKDINYFKYIIFSNEKKLLQKKRNPASNDVVEKENEKAKKHGNNNDKKKVKK